MVKSKKSCVKRIHSVTDDSLYNRKSIYKVKNNFHLLFFLKTHPESRALCTISTNYQSELYEKSLCIIWHHLCNLQNVKNTHGKVLLLVKFNFSPWVFSCFLNWINGTKLCKASHLIALQKQLFLQRVMDICLSGLIIWFSGLTI